MLVLSRKLEEQICIGPEIQITVLSIQKGRVRLGVEAPRDVPIQRQEIRQDFGASPSRGTGRQSSITEEDWHREFEVCLTADG